MRFLFGTLHSLIFSLLLLGAVVAVAYFALIKPAEDKVNDTVKAPGVSIGSARKLAECLAASQGDVKRIKRCQRRYPIAP